MATRRNFITGVLGTIAAAFIPRAKLAEGTHQARVLYQKSGDEALAASLAKKLRDGRGVGVPLIGPNGEICMMLDDQTPGWVLPNGHYVAGESASNWIESVKLNGGEVRSACSECYAGERGAVKLFQHSIDDKGRVVLREGPQRWFTGKVEVA